MTAVAKPRARANLPSVELREQLVARLWRAAERQVCAIEQRIDAGDDRSSHELAVLVKTLRELSALDPAAGRTAGEDDDAGPRDMDEFRNELEREIEALVARTDF